MHHQETQGAEDLPLSRALFAGSAEIHRVAERRPFQAIFLKAQLPRDQYVEYLGRLSYIYDALERADEALRDDPIVGRRMHAPEMYRSAAIDEDMRFFIGSDWRDRIKPTPAVEAYVDRIAWTASDFPPGFVAHQWLRYLGNVLAQRVLLRIMERAYGLTVEGTAFYRFAGIADPRAFLGEYHAKMNSMPLDDDARRLVVEEGNRAFGLQIDFTDELAADFGLIGPGEEETERILAELAAEHP